MEERAMTIKEAIYCMRSYLPENESHCTKCPYYRSIKKDGYSTCKSAVAHEMAASALEFLLEDK